MNIGIASHIAGASQGGPRFDGDLTCQQRIAAENGIWLCQVCAKLVDTDLSKYTKEVLIDWKETAEHLALTDMQGTSASSLTVAHSIAFKADDWSMWRNRGNLPGDEIVVIEGWSRGDVRYEVRLRFKNNSSQEEILHRFRMEFVDDSQLIHSDEYPFDGDDVVLPPGKWITIDVSYGLHDFNMFLQSKAVWCKAEVVGDSEPLRWLVARIDHATVKFQTE